MFGFWKKDASASASQPREPPQPVSSTSTSEGRLGLRVLHEPHPGATTTVSIIFVHGLGGSARSTWENKASNKFWPTFLHEDDNLANARISTFGYDADFKNILAAKNVLGIADFAGQLLDSLDTHYGKYGNVSPFDLAETKSRLPQSLSRIAWAVW
jgi:hypothetical protein